MKDWFRQRPDPRKPSTDIIPCLFSADDVQAEVRFHMKGDKIGAVLLDLAIALGYRDSSRAMYHLRSKDVYTEKFGGSAGTREMTMVTESGIYRLIMRSRMPAAEKFQDWVFEEVLPSIRKTGSYSVAPKPKPWSERFMETWQPHQQYLALNHPGCFTVVTAALGQMLCMEDTLTEHLLPLLVSDAPDGSIGQCWANYRRKVLLLPDAEKGAEFKILAKNITVMLSVYEDSERGTFETWFASIYLPEKLPAYFGNKFKDFGKLPAASAANQACLKLSGKHASFPAKIHKLLKAAKGIIRAGDPLPQIGDTQNTLF